MKIKKIIRNICIVLTVLLIILTLFMYLKINNSWIKIKNSTNAYTNSGLLISNIFQYGIFVYSLLLIVIIWIEYFLLNQIIKLYNKKVIITMILSTIGIVLFIMFIRILIFMFMII